MKTVTFEIDYTYCPKGHGDWVFVPSSILFSDIFWCEKCDCFYEPSVKKVSRGSINKDFNSDREQEIIRRAKFLEWKSNLQVKDMPIL